MRRLATTEVGAMTLSDLIQDSMIKTGRKINAYSVCGMAGAT